MDPSEATKIVLSRIQSIDQENASRIMGMLLIQDHGENEMIRLAFGPESLVHSVVLKARKELGLAPNSSPSPAIPHPQISPNLALTCFSPLSSISSNTSSALPFYGNRGADLADEFHLQDQFSFLDDGAAAAGHRHRRSLSDIFLGSDDHTFALGRRPCLSASVDGGSPEMMSPHQLRLSSTRPYSALTSNQYINLPLQQPQSETQRSLMMWEDMNKFGRTRFERSDCLTNPSSRQIYLTFPADSTFREEDVSNYFSNYGRVQNVRIPYQQKRMFGFVTFVYAETVRMILAKGNPHFVCDAKVLVKPYKEKGKVHDNYRKQQSMERQSPTGLDSRDPCDLQIASEKCSGKRIMKTETGGARMFCNTQDMLWSRKLAEQAELQEACSELQQAIIELRNQRLTNLQRLNMNRHNHHRALSTGAAIPSQTHSPNFFNQTLVTPFNRASPEDIEAEKGSNPATAVHATAVADQESEPTVNASEKERELTTTNCTDENGNGKENPHQQEESDLPDSLEDLLPDSPFAFPKAAKDSTTTCNTARSGRL